MSTEPARHQLPAGVWDADLDAHPEHKHEFRAHGYECFLVRNLTQWTYCGYVHLPSSHPDYGKTYDDLKHHISVHGDLTYGPGRGVFGFDCAHGSLGDVMPGCAYLKQKFNGHPLWSELFDDSFGALPGVRRHYWTFEEAKAQTEDMARQFKHRE